MIIIPHGQIILIYFHKPTEYRSNAFKNRKIIIQNCINFQRILLMFFLGWELNLFTNTIKPSKKNHNNTNWRL